MTDNSPHIAILMGTYDGGKFLKEQLDSIKENNHKEWTLFVSDDGSKDDTLKILEEYQNDWGKEKLKIVRGPGKGFCKNFLTLTDNPDVSGDYYVFCDQDDVWSPERIEKGLEILRPLDDIPALYCGRTLYVDENNNEIGMSSLWTSPPPSFSNALVQSLAGANTMMFNEKARELIRKGSSQELVSHDWWAYQIVTGGGGRIIYDPNPTVRYRQHGKNIIGGNVGALASLHRFRMGFKGEYREWNTKQTTALKRLENLLTDESREILDAFLEVRERAGFIRAVRLMRKYKIRRKTFPQQMAFYLWIFLGLV